MPCSDKRKACASAGFRFIHRLPLHWVTKQKEYKKKLVGNKQWQVKIHAQILKETKQQWENYKWFYAQTTNALWISKYSWIKIKMKDKKKKKCNMIKDEEEKKGWKLFIRKTIEKKKMIKKNTWIKWVGIVNVSKLYSW